MSRTVIEGSYPVAKPVLFMTCRGCRTSTETLRASFVHVHQDSAQDLSGRRLRDLVDELEMAHALVGRDTLGDPAHDRVGRRYLGRIVWLQHNERLRDLP